MKLLPLFALCALAMPSCIGMHYIAFHPDGTPKAALQLDAVMAEGESSAREVTLPNGVAMRSVQQRYDATRVPGAVVDAVGMVKALKIAQPSILKATKDPNVIPKDPNVIPVDPNAIPLDPNVIPLDPN